MTVICFRYYSYVHAPEISIEYLLKYVDKNVVIKPNSDSM